MKLYKDKSFSQEFQTKDFPLTVGLNEPLFIEVKIESPDDRLSVLTERCYATPNQNPLDRVTYDVIRKGYVNPFDWLNGQTDVCIDQTEKYMVTIHCNYVHIPTSISSDASNMFHRIPTVVSPRPTVWAICDSREDKMYNKVEVL